MQPPPSRSAPKNPLLTAAADDFSFGNIVPVAPAVLPEESIPPAELDSFIGQGPSDVQSPIQTYNPSASPLNLSNRHPQQQQTQQPQQPPPQQQVQSPKQGYFTSILSSLPNLSNTLASLTGDSGSSSQQQSSPAQPIQQGHPYGQTQAYNNPYDYRNNQGLAGGNFNSAVPPKPVSQPQPPPINTLPPSGGSGSYRLGNQRRLKYAPVPDLATSNTQHHFQPASNLGFPPLSNQLAPTTSFYNPNTEIFTPAVPGTDTQNIRSASEQQNQYFTGTFNSNTLSTTAQSNQPSVSNKFNPAVGTASIQQSQTAPPKTFNPAVSSSPNQYTQLSTPTYFNPTVGSTSPQQSSPFSLPTSVPPIQQLQPSVSNVFNPAVISGVSPEQNQSLPQTSFNRSVPSNNQQTNDSPPVIFYPTVGSTTPQQNQKYPSVVSTALQQSQQHPLVVSTALHQNQHYTSVGSTSLQQNQKYPTVGFAAYQQNQQHPPKTFDPITLLSPNKQSQSSVSTIFNPVAEPILPEQRQPSFSTEIPSLTQRQSPNLQNLNPFSQTQNQPLASSFLSSHFVPGGSSETLPQKQPSPTPTFNPDSVPASQNSTSVSQFFNPTQNNSSSNLKLDQTSIPQLASQPSESAHQKSELLKTPSFNPASESFQSPSESPLSVSTPATVAQTLAHQTQLCSNSPSQQSPAHVSSTSASTAILPTAPPAEASSSQGSSLQNSFRNSPTNATNVCSPSSSVNAFDLSGPPSHSFTSAPRTIPSRRFPDTTTPQNTPADSGFSGFNLFRQQQLLQNQQDVAKLGPSSINSSKLSDNIPAEKSTETTSGPDKTFTPISAAKVTEILENLILEQNDDSQSVKSELSAEVATITAGIPLRKPEKTDDLTEIDLSNKDNIQPDERFEVSSEGSQKKEQSLDYFTAPPTTNFFSNQTTVNKKTDSTVPSQNRIPEESGSDLFSFPQTEVKSAQGKVESAVAEHLTVNKDAEQYDGPNNELSKENIQLTPQSIWRNNEPNQQTQSTVVNPTYGTSDLQRNPNFYNPLNYTQSKNSSQPNFSNTASSAFETTDGIGNSNLSTGIPSYQLTSTIQEHFNVVPEPKGTATLSPVQMSVTPLSGRSPQETVPPSFQNLAQSIPERQMQYRPVYHHWFYRREVEAKTLWLPFSMHDSLQLEDVHNSNEISPETKVATDGGRYDVEILRRQRSPVYWSGPITEVRRCSWFYKGPVESRYTPYEENISARLEEEFQQACTSNNWNRRVDLNNGEYIIFHSSTVQVHYLQATTPDMAASWGNNSGSEENAYLQSSASRPKVVKRGLDEFNIDDGEPERIDHLLFLVHGIGSVCDLKFRTVEEVVDEFRSISLQLVQSHYRSSSEQGLVNRIEVLPISWHATLHSGIDKKLQMITLESIPKLRHFTNDTLLDILFYTSPIYCETIMQTVGNEMNRLYTLFKKRNPDFQGSVYLGGHSLGSLIMFDLLCHQKPPDDEQPETNGETEMAEEPHENAEENAITKPLAVPALKRKLSKKVSYVMGNAGTGQPYINYPQLSFIPKAFFALGSPIGMFVTVRGIDMLGEDFTLPTCPAFFNIFHPFDPVAYRVESLINPEAHKYRPMLIPHHKGRKRMHLELKETMARVGADLKQRLLDSVRSTWNSVYQLAMFHRQDNQTLEQEIEKVVEEQMNHPPSDPSLHQSNDDAGEDLKIGKLNGGRRIDYVLQEAPFEYINEYIFALTSHVCYWESEDTMLLILKEIYGSMGIQTDAQLPQQSLSIERVSTPTIPSSPSSSIVSSPTSASTSHGMDPTTPISSKPVGPPPLAGFVRKTDQHVMFR